MPGEGDSTTPGAKERITPKGRQGKSNRQAEMYNGVPMRTVLKTGGQTLLRMEIYGPVAIYLRLLALLVATYLGTTQCHDYLDKQCNKGGGREHRHAKVNILVLT
jgi:hypothetical protein